MPKLAILYPEIGGCLYVAQLQAGTEGSVTLVRSVITGELFVRKVSHISYSGERPQNHPEVQFSRDHLNLPRLIAAHHIDGSPPSTVVLTQYANGGSLDQFYVDNFSAPGKYFPECLVWRLLCGVLAAFHRIHLDRAMISHRDIHPGNIMMRWSATDQTSLPTFLLGDLGGAECYDPRKHSVEEKRDELRRM